MPRPIIQREIKFALHFVITTTDEGDVDEVVDAIAEDAAEKLGTKTLVIEECEQIEESVRVTRSAPVKTGTAV